MERTKKLLNLAIAFSLIVLSISAFIFSIRGSKAMAIPLPSADGFTPVGTYVINGKDKQYNEQTYICIVGFNPLTKEIKNLNPIDLIHFKLSGRK